MKKLLILLFLLPSTILMAQYFETGQDPASIKWRQINTLNFQLIYPDYYEEQAQVLAQKLELVYDFGSSTLGHKPKKISVILHTQTVQSNGLVAYAPKRSELYTTPRQSIYPQDWLEQLALHEFRHVVQIDKMNTELPQIIKIILGEQGTALLFGAYLPWWFIEGDAVVTETALSNYGRGRLPSFLVEHRAQVVDKKRYSYDKAYLGSYKDFVPDHYRLGYYLVANSRERYGAEIWGKAISRAAKKPLSLTPFNKTLKLETGMGKVKLYESIFDSLSVVWKNTDSEFQTMPSKQITPNTKTYTNYQYNYSLNEQEIISYKTSLDAVPAFVIINKNGVEKKLFSPGTIFDESVNYYGDWIVWAEQKPSVRWSHSGTSQIKLFNVRTRKSYSFSPEFKAFAPALTADLEQVAVVETDFSSNNYLSVYNITSGELKHRYQTSENNFFFSPVWLNQHEILCVVLTEAGKRIAKINLQTESHTFLSNTELGDIKQLQISENKLYFISSYSGKDALYQYNLGNGELEQLYAPRFDAAYPTIGKNGEIILSDYTGNGYRIIEVQAQNSLAIT
ncbi:MAG TPA: hypothetical protein VEP89_18085, partial [Draconibacterium sp.]|nr:hypothetical protein [Draconibacterium sp.]